MPSLLPSSHQHQHQSSSSSSSVVSLDNNNNTMKRGKVAAKAAAAARDYHRQQQQSEEDTTISSVNSTTTRTIQERVLNENNASQKRRNKLLGLFGKGSMMFVLVAMMVTASALLFPETALAKSKAVIAEQSSGFSVKVILDWILHLDKHLVELFATSGKMAYGVLFGIIFAETGFVVTPFLPGDSLLFACGALGAIGVLNFPLVYGLLFLAAVLGDTVNYMCGSFFGEVAIRKNPRIFKPDYIAKTRTFYDKYGGENGRSRSLFCHRENVRAVYRRRRQDELFQVCVVQRHGRRRLDYLVHGTRVLFRERSRGERKLCDDNRGDHFVVLVADYCGNCEP